MNQGPRASMEDPPAAPSPRPFREIPALWLKLFRMDTSFMVAELPHTSDRNTLFSVLIGAVAGGLLNLVITLILGNPELLVCQCIWALFNIGGFYSWVGVTYLLARILGGQGKFGGQAYLESLYTVPSQFLLQILSQVYVWLSPQDVSLFAESNVSPAQRVAAVVVGLLQFALLAYLYGLGVSVIQVSHKLSRGKARWAAVWIPMLFLVVLGLGLCALAAILGPALNDALREISYLG